MFGEGVGVNTYNTTLLDSIQLRHKTNTFQNQMQPKYYNLYVRIKVSQSLILMYIFFSLFIIFKIDQIAKPY